MKKTILKRDLYKALHVCVHCSSMPQSVIYVFFLLVISAMYACHTLKIFDCVGT